MRLPIPALILLSLLSPASGQQPPDGLPSFDAAAVRPGSHPRTPEGYSWSDVKVEGPGRFRAVNASLDECIRWAWSVKDYQVDEPDWLKSNAVTFDIEATAPADTPSAQMRLMLRRLLAERFGLVLHHEMKTLPAYALTLGKGGPRLKASAAAAPVGILSRGSSSTIRMTSDGATMAQFVSSLSGNVDRPVFDKTGFTGIFTLDISFARLASSGSDAASVFSALQGMGLRLEPVDTPVDIIKVDRVNAKPTAN